MSTCVGDCAGKWVSMRVSKFVGEYDECVSVGLFFNQSINHLINQSIKYSINQSTNPSINQVIN